MAYVFLSYSHKDADYAVRLETAIRERGVEVWRDAKIDPGEAWLDAIEERLDRSAAVLLIMSGNSRGSRWVPNEMTRAQRKGIQVYPLLLSGDMWLSMETTQYVDVRDGSLPGEHFYERLMGTIRDVERFGSMTPSARAAKDRLYYYGDGDNRGFVEAIRLFGAVDEVLGPDRLLLTYEPAAYTVPPDYAPHRRAEIDRLRAEARARGRLFFNGPNVRMIRMRANPPDDENVGRERKALEIALGPVGWEDYEGMNAALRNRMESTLGLPIETVLNDSIGLSALLRDGDPSRSVLSNIVDNAVTFLTSDGQVAYARRGMRVELPDRLTSAVAENINRFKDDVNPRDWRERLNHWDDSLPDHQLAPADYEPMGVPHPVAAAFRGIEEETSPRLLEHLPDDGFKLTGVSFDLQSFHPDLLYLAAIDRTADEILEICRRYPGKDFTEGQLAFVPADLGHPDTFGVLNSREDQWNPGGKASFVRTLEIIDHLEHDRGMDHSAALDWLRVAH